MTSPNKTPITILTGFTGSGKTTLLLNTLPQLPSSYTLALIKNEIGDLAVDTQLAASATLTRSKELLGECICCVNVGQIEDALTELCSGEKPPDRVVIETSGSAEPLKLVLEVNRIAKATGRYELDGIVSVIDAENWSGYASTSYTAKLQAQQTDLIVINKWESMGGREYDVFLDRLGDLDVNTPQIKSEKGKVPVEVLFGFDRGLAREWLEGEREESHGHTHTSEVECLSVTLEAKGGEGCVEMTSLERFLKSAPKDEVFRIKAVLYSKEAPRTSDGQQIDDAEAGRRTRCILNWSFGRWTWMVSDAEHDSSAAPALRMSIFTAPYESNKWSKKVREGGLVRLSDNQEAELVVKRVQ